MFECVNHISGAPILVEFSIFILYIPRERERPVVFVGHSPKKLHDVTDLERGKNFSF